ncbi:ATP-binding protein [Pseudothioclava nitratireducens]|uniref:ATP-binding protein n=1 Tax=Pseudothioclava nitratireducens TaxID=1928646 RepID=UPI0023DC284C|nr:ATP-binding protein [Defluviimonas nitratireducens]MDF1619477.1 ATP-binding protein [Defluviimonas nitratireducens]
MPFNILVAVCLSYVVVLFSVAFVAERRAAQGRLKFLHRPIVYTLSLSIYCTAWTFYGAVGYAARSGLEFVTIYLGPTLVFIGWWWILRKLVRIGRAQRVTSIADLISSRFGKSNTLGVVVTLMSVASATPYIALQLQSVTLSFGVFADDAPEFWALSGQGSTAMWIAVGLTVFTILFGTRNLDANERHHGVVMAIALEAVVKLVALMAVGVFVVWGLAGGVSEVLARIDASPIADWDLKPGRFAGLLFVSAAAILTLPRMFQVLVVENVDERHLATASWAFPAYLMGMSLFVIPIAVMGLERMPEGSNPDLFVLTLPLAEGQGKLALLAFLGGFSSATSMVIVAAIALATMVSNHIVTPLWLTLRKSPAREPGDIRGVILMSRRISIAGVLAMGYTYYSLSGGSEALAAIGLIAFVGAAQVLPALMGGIFWRGATHVGAMAGLLVGFAIWLYCLFLPSVGESGLISASVLAHGPFGIDWLRPRALFGIEGLDPLLHALFWSLLLNTLCFLIFSMASFPPPMERLQGVAFVNVFDQSPGTRGWTRGRAEAEDLLSMSQRILGVDEAQRFFQAQAAGQGKSGILPDTTPEFIARLERQLAGSVGAATAHAMIAQLSGGSSVSVQDLIAVAGEAAEIKEYSAQLEAKSEELARTARALREANDKLTELSIQKDAFLGQISHELRTPMTSIRAFSEILMEPDLPEEMRAKYAEIIHEEARRLTRLLDDLLDLSVLENRKVQLNIGVANLHDLISKAVGTASSTRPERRFRIERDFPSEHMPVFTDTDRLLQVFINLVSNARKYCDAELPKLRIEVKKRGKRVQIDFIDNGSGIPKKAQALIFEKFARLTDTSRAGGAGLGLAICREIMANLGGTIDYLPGQGGAAFRVTLPLRHRDSAADPVS